VSEPAEPLRAPAERWMQRTSLGVLGLILAAVSWLAAQAVEVRDTVRSLHDTIPIQISALDRRVSLNEGHIMTLDAAIEDDRIASRNRSSSR